MKTIELKGFVHCKPADKWDSGSFVIDGMKYDFWQYEGMQSSGYALVAPLTVKVQMPDNFNPNGQFVAALEQQKKKAMAEFQNRITEIDRQISQFQAITMEAA